MKESNILKTILLSVGKSTTARLFRNNVGTGWIGKTQRTGDGGLYIKEPRPLKAGLCKGSSDLIGWTTREITPEMVGQKIAVFTAVEVKTKSGRATTEQINFINVVRKSGGIAGIATDGDEAVNLIENYGKRN